MAQEYSIKPPIHNYNLASTMHHNVHVVQQAHTEPVPMNA